MLGWPARPRRVRPERFNHSRYKQALLRKARLQLITAGWKLTGEAFVADRCIDLSATSRLAAFDLICLDRTLQSFKPETGILEHLEETARAMRIRHRSLIVIVDGGFSAGFSKRAEARGLLMVPAADLDLVANLARYADALPASPSELELRLLGSSFSACISLAQRFQAARDTAAAIDWARRAIASRHGYSAHHFLFSLLLDAKALDEAARIGAEALAFKPKDTVRFLQGLQKIAVLRRDDVAAVGWAERWIAAEPDEPRAHENLANLHRTLRNPPAAATAIARALELAPRDAGILRSAARIALSADDLPSALARGEEWAAHAPTDAAAHEFLADIRIRQKHYAAAAAALAIALGITPDHPGLTRKAALVALDQGDIAEAIRLAERWLALAPSDPWAYDCLSRIHLHDGRYGDARAATIKALAIEPGNARFLRRAAEIETRTACLAL